MTGFDPPRPFPRITLPDLGGTPGPVADAWAGSRALVAIGHTDCETTRLVLPYLKRMGERRGPGSAVLLILQDAAAAAKAFLSGSGLEPPVRLEPDPYPLSRELGLRTVPTLLLVGPSGLIERASEGFKRADIEGFAEWLGVPAPFFLEGDVAPALRPG